MLLSLSHSPSLERPQTRHTSKLAWSLDMATSGKTHFALLVICDQNSPTPQACYLVIPQVFVGQGEDPITGRGAQDSVLRALFVHSSSPFFLLSCLSEWLLYAKPCARC